MSAALGFVRAIDFSSEQELVLDEYLRHVFTNEFPIFTRLDRVAGISEKFTIISYQPRPLRYTYVSGAAGTAPAAGTVEVWTFSDCSQLLNGDVLDAGGERVVVTIQSTNGTTCSVRRGAESTTVLAGASIPTTASGIDLIGNARKGDEIDQLGNRAPRTTVDQYHQRFNFPVTASGGLLDVQDSLVKVQGGSSDLYDQMRAEKLLEFYQSAEKTLVYGKAQAPAAGIERHCAGLRNLVGNLKTSPTNASTYGPEDLVADLFQPAFEAGGMIDVCFCSPGFMNGLHTWGYAKTQIYNLGQNALGVNIQGYVLPFHGRDVAFIPAPLLGSSTKHAILGLTSEEVKLSQIRPATWFDSGRRGDVREGSWIADIAPKLINPGHHSMVENITAFQA